MCQLIIDSRLPTQDTRPLNRCTHAPTLLNVIYAATCYHFGSGGLAPWKRARIG